MKYKICLPWNRFSATRVYLWGNLPVRLASKSRRLIYVHKKLSWYGEKISLKFGCAERLAFGHRSRKRVESGDQAFIELSIEKDRAPELLLNNLRLKKGITEAPFTVSRRNLKRNFHSGNPSNVFCPHYAGGILRTKCSFCNNIHEKLLDSDWLRAMQFRCNTNLVPRVLSLERGPWERGWCNTSAKSVTPEGAQNLAE